MIVVDTSAIVDRLVARPRSEQLASRLDHASLRAPHLVDIEFLSALRQLVSHRALDEADADAARIAFRHLSIRRYPHVLLHDRIWELRHNLSAYDAAYVALSEALEVPLVIADRRLADAPGHRAEVEVFARRPW
ncbi:PIN domain-containing protein [soil metagenome]